MLHFGTVAPLALKKGDKIDSWILEARLGEGGQAEVWSARSPAKHTPRAALKFCSHSDAQSRARFARELELLEKHAHARIVRVKQKGDYRGIPYFAMDLANRTLEHVVTKTSPGLRVLQRSPGLLLDLFRQACDGVAHLHANDVLHRDIKPSNILLFLEGAEPIRAVLADLGIGSLAADQGALTRTLESVGTPDFRAPEAAQGRHSKASDVYSLGKTLEFIFTRRVPHDWGPGTCSRDASVADPLWDALDALMDRACALKPGQRFQDAGDLLTAIPQTVLTMAGSPAPAAVDTAESVPLHSDEVTALNAVIGACVSQDDAPSAYFLQRESRLSKHAFSMALRNLGFRGLVETFRGENQDGYYSAVRPTDAGFRLALSYRDQAPPPLEGQRATLADDDIPF